MPKLFDALRRFAGPSSRKLELTKAWQRLRGGNATIQDFELVLTDLVDMTGYYRRPNYADWMKRTQTPNGFELHSALSNARAEVVQHMMGFLTLTDDELVSLERSARAERER